MLPAGELMHRVTFQQRATPATVNALGEPTSAWVDLASVPTVWARCRPLRSREQAAMGQLQQHVDIVVECRHRADITADMRLLWRGEPYEIVGEPLDVEGRGEDLRLYCVKGLRDGR